MPKAPSTAIAVPLPLGERLITAAWFYGAKIPFYFVGTDVLGSPKKHDAVPTAHSGRATRAFPCQGRWQPLVG